MESNALHSAPRTSDFLLPAGTYLLSHAMGALPKRVMAVKDSYFLAWAEKGNDAWDFYMSGIERFRGGLARLLGGKADEYCPQANVSSGLAKIVSALHRSKTRPKILFNDADFPTVGHLLNQTKRYGYEPAFLPDPRLANFEEMMMEALDERVELLFLSHAFFGSSTLIDPTPFIQRARELGIVTVVDVAQSAGVVPIDVAQWDADFVLGVGHKWLCGGHGSSFLWANSKTISHFEPANVGWFSHKNPMGFDIHHFEYAQDSRRFWGGTPSVLPYLVAAQSIELLAEIGVKSIRAHNLALADRAILLAEQADLIVVTPKTPKDRGGTITVACNSPESALPLFRQRQIFVDYRKGYGIRLSPHIYNTLDEIDRAMGAFAHCSRI